ncbi:MAG TPA: hypothetical protein VFT99_20890, partial [Roseiflexaceae bacterium]|nr:hypothetical protein [Roseiflexaceae bacterium]
TRLEESALLFAYPRLLGEDDTYELPASVAWNPTTWSEYEQGSLPPPIVLAHITLAGGNPSIDGSVRRYAGLRLPGGASPEPSVVRADQAGTLSVATMTGGQLVSHVNLSQNGNLAIGTADTTRARLAVSGDIALLETHVLRFYNRLNDAHTEIGSGAFDSNRSNFWVRSADASHYGLFFDGSSGNVGIGTTDPQAQLHVGGALTVAGAATLQQGLTVAGSLQIQSGPAVNEFSTEASLADNSDSALPTERAVRGYVDAAGNRLGTRIGTLEGANLPNRVGALEGANLNGRVGTLEGANLNGRLSTLEGANLNGRVGTLERGKHPYGGSLNDGFTTNQLNIASGVNNFVIDSCDTSPNNGYIRFGDGTGWRLNFGRLRETPGQQGWNRGTSGVLMVLTDQGHLGLGTLVSHEMMTIDPHGAGGLLIGNPETGANDYTSLAITISQEKNGYANLQAITAAGRLYGNIIMNALGGNVGIGTSAPKATLDIHGSLNVDGAKRFAIPHPLRPNYTLVHACIEGPEAGVYYRGVAHLRDGRAMVRLPCYFEALTRQEGRTVQLTAIGERPFSLSYTPITDGAFCVHGACAEGAFAWQVTAVRADIAELQVEVANNTSASEENHA